MSSAKSRSPSDSVNVHMVPLLTPMSVLFIIQSIARQNRKGDNIHPCFTPVLIRPGAIPNPESESSDESESEFDSGFGFMCSGIGFGVRIV